MPRKLKVLTTKTADCLGDDQYVGIFVDSVMDYAKKSSTKRLMSWEEFSQVISERRVVTLKLSNWKGHSYIFESILTEETIFDDTTRHYDIEVHDDRFKCTLQIDSNESFGGLLIQNGYPR